MAAGEYNITIEQGAVFRKVLTWTDSEDAPINLTGYTALMQIRKEDTGGDVIIELSTLNDKIVITPAEGKIELFIPATETAEFSFDSAYYDLELIPPSEEDETVRLLQGKVTLSTEITKQDES